MQNHWLFSSNNIYFCKCQKADEKKSKEDKQTLEELNSAHSHSQTKCQWVQTSYIKQSKLLSFLPYNKHLINLIKSVYMCIWRIWEMLDLGCVFRPHCIRSVLTTSVKILPYRPPAQLIRAKYYTCTSNNKHFVLFLWRDWETWKKCKQNIWPKVGKIVNKFHWLCIIIYSFGQKASLTNGRFTCLNKKKQLMQNTCIYIQC